MLSDKFRQLFNKIVDVVFAIILLFIMLGIAVGALQLFSTLWELLRFEGITGKYIDLIADVFKVHANIVIDPDSGAPVCLPFATVKPIVDKSILPVSTQSNNQWGTENGELPMGELAKTKKETVA